MRRPWPGIWPTADRRPSGLNRFSIGEIASRPSMYSRCDERDQFVTLRRFPYSLIYRCEGEAAEVVAVAHEKRRTGYWVSRA